MIECERPNTHFYQFNGRITFDHTPVAGSGSGSGVAAATKTVKIPVDSVLLRGTRLHTTDWIIGIVINTGVDTKV
jgi:hypothetical protein